MDVSCPRRARGASWLFACVAMSGVLHFGAHSAFAFTDYTHEWITKNAFEYMKSRPQSHPATGGWTGNLGYSERYMQELLTRAVIDTDYRSDVWLDAIFHDPFVGGETDGILNFFTTMFHHINVTSPGKYWEFDGYSYEKSTRSGNDGYLSVPTVRVMGSLSKPLGGYGHSRHPVHGADLGAFRTGFKGTTAQWNKLYFYDNAASDAYFPPAYVPGALAYQAMLNSARAPANSSESWNETVPLVTGVFSISKPTRHYWRGEVGGLPKSFDALGITMHMAQDMAMPHHTEGTADLCHPELETKIDQWACNTPSPPNKDRYARGVFEGYQFPICNALYDPSMVDKIRRDYLFLDPLFPVPVDRMLINVARISSRWRWAEINRRYDLETVLPSGGIYQADTCEGLFRYDSLKDAARFQYNLGVAVTVAIFEMAAREYETRQASLVAKPAAYDFYSMLKSILGPLGLLPSPY